MEKLQQYQHIKFSPINSNVLGVLSYRDIQIFKFEQTPYMDGGQHNRSDHQLKMQ